METKIKLHFRNRKDKHFIYVNINEGDDLIYFDYEKSNYDTLYSDFSKFIHEQNIESSLKSKIILRMHNEILYLYEENLVNKEIQNLKNQLSEFKKKLLGE